MPDGGSGRSELFALQQACTQRRTARDNERPKEQILPGDVAQLVEQWTGTSLTQVRFPGAARDFSPTVNIQCRLLRCPYTPVCNRTHQHLCACEKSCSLCQSSVNYGNTKTPRMHRGLGSATLSQLAFPGESYSNFPWYKFQ